MNKEFMDTWLRLWENPLFAQRFIEFFASMQQVGLEAARKSWAAHHGGDSVFGNAAELFEPMIAFYSSLGFVPKKQHDQVVKENEELKKENEFLKKTLRELNLKVFSEGSRQVQEMWKETAQKQIEMSAEIAKNFLDIFKQQSEK
jgi:regulator of replication initiation timing